MRSKTKKILCIILVVVLVLVASAVVYLHWLLCTGNSGLPLRCACITSTYGPRISPITSTLENHTGIDLSNGFEGSEVKAIEEGFVFNISHYPSGYIVDLRNPGVIYTSYIHLSKTANLTIGHRVNKSDVIGYVGNANGPHLHFEVRDGFFTILDPNDFVHYRFCPFRWNDIGE